MSTPPDCIICSTSIPPGKGRGHITASGVSHEFFHKGCRNAWRARCFSLGLDFTCPLCRHVVESCPPFRRVTATQVPLPLQQIPITPHEMHLIQAAERGDINHAILLLQRGAVSKAALGSAVQAAAANGHETIMENLLASGEISDEDRERTTEPLAVNGSAGMLRNLLRSGNISSKARGDAIKLATMYGHPKIVEILLQNGPISNEDKQEALEYARAGNHQSIVNLLQRKNRFLQATIYSVCTLVALAALGIAARNHLGF